MTKKDYVLVATAICSQQYAIGMDTKEVKTALYELALVLAGRFRVVNPRFDSDKFMRSCGFPVIK